jgi:hypothetical protein
LAKAGPVRMLTNWIHGLSAPDTAGDRKAASTTNLAGARRRTARYEVDVVGRDGLLCVEEITARSGGIVDLTDFFSGCTAYPSHLRPVSVQRLQDGFSSSHFTLRIYPIASAVARRHID